MKKLILSSTAQVSQLLTNNPALLSVPGLMGLKPLAEPAPKSKCSSCNKTKVQQNLRPQIEAALSNLTVIDYETIKSLLGLDQLCYYHKVNGKLTQTCL